MRKDSEWLDIWNKLHIKFVAEEMENCNIDIRNGFKYMSPSPELIGYRNNRMADFLEELLPKAKVAYYTSDTPIMSDYQYDKFEEFLRSLRPNSKILKKVGY